MSSHDPYSAPEPDPTLRYAPRDPVPQPPDSPRPGGGPRPVVTGLLVAVLAAIGGAAIAHEAWTSNHSSSNQNFSGQPFGGQFGQLNPSQGGNGASTGNASASTAKVAGIAAKVDPGIVDIDTVLANGTAAAGTGMVVTAAGEVITNNHVITEATRISATDIGNGRTYNAHVIGYDTSRDIAVIALEGASGLATVSLGDSSSVRVGQSVVTIGNAGGIGGTPSAAAGSVAGLDQSITAGDEATGTEEQLTGLIELDGELQPGDSGGPLVDTSASVIGMDTAASSTFSFQSSGGEGFAIPIDEVQSVASEILTGKRSDTVHIGKTGLIGVEIGTAANDPNCPPTIGQGVAVCDVVNGGPAAAAGLARGDTITSVAGVAVSSPTAMVAVKDRFYPGRHLSLTWLDTNGDSHTTTVTLGTGPPD